MSDEFRLESRRHDPLCSALLRPDMLAGEPDLRHLHPTRASSAAASWRSPMTSTEPRP